MSRTTEAKKKLRQRSYDAAMNRKEDRLIEHKANMKRAAEERQHSERYGAGSFTFSQIHQRAKYYERLIEQHGAGHFKNADAVHKTIALSRNLKVIDGDLDA